MKTAGFKIIALMAMLSLFATGCQTTRKVIQYADSFEAAIDEFEESRGRLSEVAFETTLDAFHRLTERDRPDLQYIAGYWEVEWRYVKAAYAEFADTFVEVTATSRDYFDRLDRLAKEIKSAGLRDAEELKNSRLKTQWNDTFNGAQSNMASLRALIHEGDDFHIMLLGASLREKLSRNVEHLKSMGQRVRSLLNDLSMVTRQGRRLVGS